VHTGVPPLLCSSRDPAPPRPCLPALPPTSRAPCLCPCPVRAATPILGIACPLLARPALDSRLLGGTAPPRPAGSNSAETDRQRWSRASSCSWGRPCLLLLLAHADVARVGGFAAPATPRSLPSPPPRPGSRRRLRIGSARGGADAPTGIHLHRRSLGRRHGCPRAIAAVTTPFFLPSPPPPLCSWRRCSFPRRGDVGGSPARWQTARAGAPPAAVAPRPHGGLAHGSGALISHLSAHLALAKGSGDYGCSKLTARMLVAARSNAGDLLPLLPHVIATGLQQSLMMVALCLYLVRWLLHTRPTMPKRAVALMGQREAHQLHGCRSGGRPHPWVASHGVPSPNCVLQSSNHTAPDPIKRPDLSAAAPVRALPYCYWTYEYDIWTLSIGNGTVIARPSALQESRVVQIISISKADGISLLWMNNARCSKVIFVDD
ncbi:hypothetical protein U9M48_020644, partial [Paspalum notatum var. saurae]